MTSFSVHDFHRFRRPTARLGLVRCYLFCLYVGHPSSYSALWRKCASLCRFRWSWWQWTFKGSSPKSGQSFQKRKVVPGRIVSGSSDRGFSFLWRFSRSKLQTEFLLNFCLWPNHFFKANHSSGTTACVAFIEENILYVANAGDSRCVVSRSGKAMDMSVDHNPTNPKEAARIEIAGGAVTEDGRIDGHLDHQLNLSRALGKLRFDCFCSTSSFLGSGSLDE